HRLALDHFGARLPGEDRRLQDENQRLAALERLRPQLLHPFQLALPDQRGPIAELTRGPLVADEDRRVGRRPGPPGVGPPERRVAATACGRPRRLGSYVRSSSLRWPSSSYFSQSFGLQTSRYIAANSPNVIRWPWASSVVKPCRRMILRRLPDGGFFLSSGSVNTMFAADVEVWLPSSCSVSSNPIRCLERLRTDWNSERATSSA